MSAVDDLLRMVSGIDWNESGGMDTSGGRTVPLNDVAQALFEAPNAAAFVGALPQNATPGTYWNYSTGNFQLLQYNLRYDPLLQIQLHLFPKGVEGVFVWSLTSHDIGRGTIWESSISTIFDGMFCIRCVAAGTIQ